MLSSADIKARFPELVDAADALVESKIAQASRSIDPKVWGALVDDGVAYLAAHLLALSPFGTNAGLRLGGGANQKTVYGDTLEAMQRRVGTAFRTVLE